MRRSETIERLVQPPVDLLVIGAGIVGARIAFEGSRLGLRVLLVDAGDFGGGTSSASSKLVHGGFRYLSMGDIGLVRQSQRERQLLLNRIAPNLVRSMPFLLPAYQGSPTSTATVAAGLALYRALAGPGGRVRVIGRSSARNLVPPIRTDGMRLCGVFDEAEALDSRLVLATVKAAVRMGALVLNHAPVVDLELRHNRDALISLETGDQGRIEIRARHVINAAGPWVDMVRRLDEPAATSLVRLSKGIHVLLPLDEEWAAGVAFPLASHRVALGIPWQGMLMLGTTDTLYVGDPSDVRVEPEDVACVLREASGFLPPELLRPESVRFQFAGLRALPETDGDTASAHRGHMIDVSRNGLISVAGGKLTTHRLIAWDALRRLDDPRFEAQKPDCSRLPGTGWSLRLEARTSLDPDISDHLERLYGDEAGALLELATILPDGLERIHPSGPDVWAQVDYGFESEWACTVDDVARRRTTLAVRGLMTDEISNRILSLGARRVQHEAYPSGRGELARR